MACFRRHQYPSRLECSIVRGSATMHALSAHPLCILDEREAYEADEALARLRGLLSNAL